MHPAINTPRVLHVIYRYQPASAFYDSNSRSQECNRDSWDLWWSLNSVTRACPEPHTEALQHVKPLLRNDNLPYPYFSFAQDICYFDTDQPFGAERPSLPDTWSLHCMTSIFRHAILLLPPFQNLAIDINHFRAVQAKDSEPHMFWFNLLQEMPFVKLLVFVHKAKEERGKGMDNSISDDWESSGFGLLDSWNYMLEQFTEAWRSEFGAQVAPPRMYLCPQDRLGISQTEAEYEGFLKELSDELCLILTRINRSVGKKSRAEVCLLEEHMKMTEDTLQSTLL